MLVYSVPMNGSEAAGDLVLIQTSLFFFFFFFFFSCKSCCPAAFNHLHKKSKEVSFKTRSSEASLPFIGQVTQPQL